MIGDNSTLLPEEQHQSSFKRSLQAVKLAIPLEQYAATLTELKPFGSRWWLGRCPLPDHEDTDPSFYVYPDGDGAAHAHCYGCEFHGDIFDLFQACEGGELWEAMMELARRFNVEVPARPRSWFRRQERQRPIRNGIEAAKVHVARRRLYRRYFEPLVLATNDPEDRDHDAQLFWEATLPLAEELVGAMMRNKR